MLATPQCGSAFINWVINNKYNPIIAVGPCALEYFDVKFGGIGNYCGVGNWDSTAELTVDHMTREFNPTVGDWPSSIPFVSTVGQRRT